MNLARPLTRSFVAIICTTALASGTTGWIASPSAAASVSSKASAAAASADPPYNAAVGQRIVNTAEALVLGGQPWKRGCTDEARSQCIPYSWAGGHGPRPGPSDGKCGEGWNPPDGAPDGLRNGPECYKNGDKNGTSNGRFGLDCSGFTRLVYYLAYGTDVLGSGRTFEQPTRPEMRAVPANDRKPGDLLAYPGHIGIFIGNSSDGFPVIVNEPHAYNKIKGTSGDQIDDWTVAYAGRTTLGRSLAKEARYSRYTGEASGPVSVIRKGGPGWGAILGHDGRIWLAGPGFPARTVQAVEPATRKVTVYRPKFRKGGIDDITTAPAIDGHGMVWLAGQTANSDNSQEQIGRMVPSTRAFKQFDLPKPCGAAVAGLYSDSDGNIWVECGGEFSESTVVVRVKPDGKFDTIKPLAKAPLLGPLTRGTNGSMWAVGFSQGFSAGVVRINAGGEDFFPDKNGVGAQNIAGNGTGSLVESGICPGTIETICYETVSNDGARSIIINQKQALNAIVQYTPGMDAQGDVWVLAALESGWCYYEVTSGGTVHKFDMPTYNNVDEPEDPPIVTFDGAIWTEMGRNPDYLLRVMLTS